jgi:APA family basic amino acid/polyamine antiporter
MIGSGVFLLPSSLAAYGSISLLGWLFSSIGAILLAVVFGNHYWIGHYLVVYMD